jgi:hypothetical protein
MLDKKDSDTSEAQPPLGGTEASKQLRSRFAKCQLLALSLAFSLILDSTTSAYSLSQLLFPSLYRSLSCLCTAIHVYNTNPIHLPVLSSPPFLSPPPSGFPPMNEYTLNQISKSVFT